MTSDEKRDFPDLDLLINAAEDRSGTGESSGEGSHSDKGAFNPDEYAGVVQWYNEQSRNLQRHYDIHLEHQKQKLAEENEAGLLDALQQSLKNFESDHISDFACLSSLDNTYPSSMPCLIPSSEDSNIKGFEKPSMLKELLVGAASENYLREVDSPDCIDASVNKIGDISLSPNSPTNHQNEVKTGVKKLKPFAELLKHMEAAEIKTKKPKVASALCLKPAGTRLVNTKQYMKKYGVKQDSHQTHLKNTNGKTNGTRIILHPVSNSMKKAGQGFKTLTLSLKPSSIAKFGESNSTPLSHASVETRNNIPSKELMSITGTGTKLVSEPANTTGGKRYTTSPIDPVPRKKPRSMSNAIRSKDHDYCTTQPVKGSSGKNSSNVPEKRCTQDKGMVQKVLKWEDYLQQVRAGVRSAPNSPTCSPKVTRGSARPCNNFMVVSIQGNQTQAKFLTNTVTKKRNPNVGSTVSLPEPLQKNTVKQSFGLQEFDKYITVLQNNLNSSKGNASVPNTSAPVVINVVNHQDTAGNAISFRNAPATHSLAEMVKQQHCESLQKKQSNRAPTREGKQLLLEHSSRISGTNLAVDQKITPASGSSGQLVMIQVPVSGGITSNNITAERKSSSQGTTQIASKMPNCDVSESSSNNCHSTSAQAAPTFKLMTSNKDGSETKSLLLSGVTGKLKEILTLMAEQQAKRKIENETRERTSSHEQQLNTLQKLVSDMKSHVPKTEGFPATSEMGSISNSKKSSDVQCLKGGKIPAPMTLMHEIWQNCGQKLVPPTEGAPPKSECIQNTTPDVAVLLDNRATITETVKKDSSDPPLQRNENSPSDNMLITKSIVDKQVPLTSKSYCTDANGYTSSLTHSALTEDLSRIHNDNGTPKSLPTKFSVSRSMAAAEMLASDVIEHGTEEVMIYEKPKQIVNHFDDNNNKVEVGNDHDPAVITLEDALGRLEDDTILNGCSPKCAIADALFCKLPSYFMTGKLVSEEKQEASIEGLKKRGMKNLQCDPLISNGETGVEYNKLPHYLSSGKTSARTNMSKSIAGSSGSDFAIKLNPVGDSQHLTPQGTPVNTLETYYSRLPTYYSYGRPHPPVKTFNDEVADAIDDTVTPETLTIDKKNHHHGHSRQKCKMKRKRHSRKSKKEECTTDKVLYSKLPSYYLAGRILNSQEKDVSKRISPLPKTKSTKSFSTFSLSCSSRSSQSRSRSPSRRRYSSRSYSRSPSWSTSGSEGESRRSWKKERRSHRSRREISWDRRSYDSSDEDHDDFVWHREREAWKAHKQHQEKKEKDQQHAMEERRVVYVGGVDEKVTKQDLRRKFLHFGNIEAVSLHFRDDGDNYGFLTFQYTSDAFRAIEEGPKLGPGERRYDLCFGGRRQFCKTAYEDLDSKVAMPGAKTDNLDDFDALLRQAKRGLRP